MMAVGAVLLRLDTRDLEKWGAAAVRLIESNARSAIDKAARKARAEAIRAMAEDSGVPRGRFAKAVPPVRTTRPGNLVASWTVGKSKNSIRGPSGREIANIPRGTSVAAASYVLSGGGSASMTLAKAFVIRSNGGKVIMTRIGKGRNAIKGVYAESPHTAMRGDRKAVTVWRQTAEQRVRANLATSVQAALDLSRVSSSSSADDYASR